MEDWDKSYNNLVFKTQQEPENWEPEATMPTFKLTFGKLKINSLE